MRSADSQGSVSVGAASIAEEALRVAALPPLARPRVSWLECFGLTPLGASLREARKAIGGTAGTPATQWGLSSSRIFKPHISLPTWLGRTRNDRKVWLYNFFNRNQPPRSAPYSVKVSFCRDYRGGQWTYDSHAGTDLAVPVGTPVVAAAPGKVLRVDRELDHGGLKVCMDHGEGLFTTSEHLSRALVVEGAIVGRGQAIGLSGAAGLELLLFFPWVAPHVHMSIWLNGDPIDPFAREDEVSLWRFRNDPRPWAGEPVDEPPFSPSEWDAEGVEAAIDACRDAQVRAKARSFPLLERRAAEILLHRNHTSAAFDSFPPLYLRTGTPRPCLDLPFRTVDFTGAKPPR